MLGVSFLPEHENPTNRSTLLSYTAVHKYLDSRMSLWIYFLDLFVFIKTKRIRYRATYENKKIKIPKFMNGGEHSPDFRTSVTRSDC